MSSAHSMNATKCVNAQNPTSVRHSRMNQTKVGGKGKKETGKTEARRLMERKAAQQNKNLSEELKQDLTRQCQG